MGSSHPPHPVEECLNCECRQLRAFCNLPPGALRDFDSVGVVTNHPRGAKLFSEGDSPRNVFVICHGRIKLSATSRDGKTMILRLAAAGDVMGLSAALANVPYEVTAEALEPSQVKTVRRQDFLGLLERHGIASMHAAQALSSEYLTVFQDAQRLALSGSATGRVAQLLLDWGKATPNGALGMKFTMALTHEEVANIAGTSRETVSRLLNQFRRDGLIRIKGTSLTILEADKLERLIG